MKLLLTILKWVLLIIFFPLSLVFVGYYKQQQAKKTYRKRELTEAEN